MKTDKKVIKKLLEALEAAKAHLEYCGYDDDWERDYARREGLREKINEAIKYAK